MQGLIFGYFVLSVSLGMFCSLVLPSVFVRDKRPVSAVVEAAPIYKHGDAGTRHVQYVMIFVLSIVRGTCVIKSSDLVVGYGHADRAPKGLRVHSVCAVLSVA